jgi:hypothetical protein
MSTLHKQTFTVTINYKCDEKVDWEQVIGDHLNQIAAESAVTNQPIALQPGCDIIEVAAETE